MIHTNDEISDLIVRSTQLVLKIQDMIKNQDEHNCAYRVVYRTHDLLVTKILEELQQLTNEKVSIEHINARDFTEAINDIKEVANQVSSSKRYVPPTGTLYRQIGESDERNDREEGY